MRRAASTAGRFVREQVRHTSGTSHKQASAAEELAAEVKTRLQSAREESAEFVKKGQALFNSTFQGDSPAGERASSSAGQDSEASSAPRHEQGDHGASTRSRASFLARARDMAVQAARTVDYAVRAELRLAMMDSSEAAAERARERAASSRVTPAAGVPLNREVTALSVVQPRQSAWQRRWGLLSSLTSPVFHRLGAVANDTAVLRKTRDLADDMRERWETSDNPLVHKIQDLSDSMRIQETDTARATATIMSNEPGFDMHTFVALVRRDVPHILSAYLKADVTALKAAGIAEPLLERLSAMMRTWTVDNLTMDSTVLDVSDPEVVEVKLVEGAPLVVLQFQVQQINCVRDAKGAVHEGAPDDVQSVYYAWAMEQVPPKPDADWDAQPVWRLRDVMVRGMHAIT